MIKRVREPDVNFDLAERTTAERIWLWRHRQHSNLGAARGRRTGSMSQVEAAGRLDLSPQQYIKLENGETTLLSAKDLVKLREWPDRVEETFRYPVTVGELCFLARRRSGRPVAQVARDLNATTTTYSKWETEGDNRVKQYWESLGYRFPEGLVAPAPRAALAYPRRTPLPVNTPTPPAPIPPTPRSPPAPVWTPPPIPRHRPAVPIVLRRPGAGVPPAPPVMLRRPLARPSA